MTTNAPMKRFITVGLRRYKSADNAFTTRWDWDMMRKVPGIDPRNTPQAAERLVDIGLVPELTFYVDLLQPGSGDGEERERHHAASYIRSIADALGLIIVPLGRNVYEAFCAVDPRIRGQRIGQTDCGVLCIPNPHNKLSGWWSRDNVEMIRDEVERLVDSDDYVDGVEVDIVGDAMRDGYDNDGDGEGEA